MSLLRRTIENKEGNPSNNPEEQRAAALRAAAWRQAAMARRGPARPDYTYSDLKSRIQDKLLAELDPNISDSHSLRLQMQDLYMTILAEENMLLSKSERERLFESILADISGLGPLEILLGDDTVRKIFVNGPKNIFIEDTKGKITLSGVTFENDEHVLRIITRILARQSQSYQDEKESYRSRLADGSIVSIITRPVCLSGPSITIFKSPQAIATYTDPIRFAWLSAEAFELLCAASFAGENILVVGNSTSATIVQWLLSLAPLEYQGFLSTMPSQTLGQSWLFPVEERFKARDFFRDALQELSAKRLFIDKLNAQTALPALEALQMASCLLSLQSHLQNPHEILRFLAFLALENAPAHHDFESIRKLFQNSISLIVVVNNALVEAIYEVLAPETIGLQIPVLFQRKHGREFSSLIATGNPISPRLREIVDEWRMTHGYS